MDVGIINTPLPQKKEKEKSFFLEINLPHS
jgi:hypothetical protein